MADQTVNIQIKAKDNASPAVKKVGKSMSNLKPILAGVAAGFSAIAIKSFIDDSINLFRVQEKAEARLLASVGNLKSLGDGYEKTDANVKAMTNDLKAYASGLQEVTTFGDEAIISGMALLGSFQLSGEEMKTLTPALLDMAAATEKTSGAQADLNDLANAMGKALSGGAGALSRYGVVLTDAQKEQFNTAKGMEKTSLLAQILADNFGGAATELANTTSGQLTQAANNWGDFKERVGAIVAPLLANVATWLVWLVTEAEKGFKIMFEAWDGMWVAIFSAYYTAKEALGNAWHGFWNGIRDTFNGIIDPIIGTINRLISAIDNVLRKIREFTGSAQSGLNSAVDAVYGAFFAEGGIVKPIYASTGAMIPRGTDTVPAMLTPGELVLNEAQQKNLAGKLSGTTINITVTGNTLLDSDAGDIIGKQIIKSLTRRTNVQFN